MAEIGRDQIWMFAFPGPDKRRPVLMLTRQDMLGRLHTVTVAPHSHLTTQNSKLSANVLPSCPPASQLG